MKERKHFMKNCPSCLREVPPFWDTCFFCGNVFKKSKGDPEIPTMLYWDKKTKPKNILYISERTLEKAKQIKQKDVTHSDKV